MALQDYSERKKKRKRPYNSPKLLVGHKVEVRSVDEGSMGSWHSAVVISRKNRVRDVQYDFLFSDDGSKKLIEEIAVHPVVDGITPIGRMRVFYRGLIRPLPPPLDFDISSLHYGQCVDAYYQEAWWEGVVFDHENDAEFRSIFFPDIGDIMRIGFDSLRITQDWDEFTEEWQPRGNWIFLELIEEFKQETMIHVSVREIWYDVSEKEGFEKLKEWTNFHTRREVWEILVMEVINDHSKLAAEMFFKEVTDSMLRGDHDPLFKSNTEEEGRRLDICLLSSSNSSTHVKGLPSALLMKHDESARLHDSNQTSPDSGSCVSDKPTGEKNANECKIAGQHVGMIFRAEKCLDFSCKSKKEEGRRLDISCSNSDTTHEETPCSAPSILPCNAAAVISDCRKVHDLDISTYESSRDRRVNFKRKWVIAGTDIVPEAEFCPGSVVKYLSESKSNNHNDLALSLRKHLVYLGWKIEVSRDAGIVPRWRMRYTSPKGRSYMSLASICKDWNVAQNNTRGGKETKVCAPPPSSHAPIYSPADIVEPANFPDAVKYYATFIGSGEQTKKTKLPRNATPEDMEGKAKSHLVASGWSVWTNEAGNKHALRYTSPSGKTYSSLAIACKAYTNGEVNYGVEAAFISEQRKRIDVRDEVIDKLIATDRLPSNIPVELVEFGRATLGGHHNKGAHGGSPLTFCNDVVQRKGRKTSYSEKKKEKKQQALEKVRDDMDDDDDDDDYSVHCSKRPARQVDSTSSFRSPLTVLSWLIDNDVVLPRSKVYYLGRKTSAPIKEGLVTREGIRCSCCKIVFGLQKFQAHAGSTHEHDRPAANIYLEDGRSLLGCQSQLRNRYRIKKMLTPSPQPKRRNTNDSICSACHFGGLLVMCDHCPSSFHRECLGLKDIPDGEWFCPQCCCGICGNIKFNLGAKRIMQGSILNCHQCECRYHLGCVLKQGEAYINNYREGKWFCSRKCEQIFLGLHKLLEKPVVVGDGNLTWTLLKYIPRDGDLDGVEPSVETYSKLNLVVSVMHECFEPMNEPGTKTDIVEDVIFSRGSNLNRLNFEGFYTVILSRDEELITVAAVRVHGKKVAEVPLVGTRFQYRKLGMCRFLMDELEKKLIDLGVERIVMPSAPSVLNTWTASFGFSKITESERLNLRSYTFLDFQGAVMCHKTLTVSAQPIRTLQSNFKGVDGTIDVNSNENRTTSEVFQAEQTKVANTVYQVTANSAVANGVSRNLPLVLRMDQRSLEKRDQVMGLTEEGDWSDESENKKRRGVFKCYKRRRLLQLAE